jgi:hypothetical protein
MQQWKEQERGFLRLLFGRKSMHFSAIRYCKKCTGKSNAEKKSRKGLIAKISANNLCQRNETPLYDHVLGDKRDSDKDKV